MNKKKLTLDEMPKNNPFKVPEGYFEALPDTILKGIEENERATTKVVSLWDKVKPWAYLAAMFVGIALLFNVFKSNFTTEDMYVMSADTTKPTVDSLWEDTDMDDYYEYLEYQVIKQNYRETLFTGE